jgi:2'-hydroxyisoflavone reductase
LKAACERVLDEIYGDRVTHVRAGLIVGPHDPTDRFTYWPRRLAEGGDVLAPGDPDAPLQFVDARDLAAWMLELAKRGPGGPLNATGQSEPITMRQALEWMGGDVTLHWVDDQTLLDEGVGPWMELPLWLPGPEWAHLLDIDITKALAAGLTFRSLEETARDTLAWSLEAGEQRPTLTRERERQLLAE